MRLHTNPQSDSLEWLVNNAVYAPAKCIFLLIQILCFLSIRPQKRVSFCGYFGGSELFMANIDRHEQC